MMEHKGSCNMACPKEEIIQDMKSDIGALFEKTSRLDRETATSIEAISTIKESHKSFRVEVQNKMTDFEKNLQKITNQMYWTAGKIAGGVAVASILVGVIVKKLMEAS